MISIFVAAVTIGSQGVEPLDFKLGWKVGDSLTYVVNAKNTSGVLDVTGEMVMTVTAENEKSYTISTSQVKFKKLSTAGFGDLDAGSLTMSKTGKIIGGATNTRAFLMFLSLPESPTELGGAYKVDYAMPGIGDVGFDGKFVSMGGSNGTLATLALNGEVPIGGGNALEVPVNVTFDTARGVFASYSFTMAGITNSIKLKAPSDES